jgi:hypothetical protein
MQLSDLLFIPLCNNAVSIKYEDNDNYVVLQDIFINDRGKKQKTYNYHKFEELIDILETEKKIKINDKDFLSITYHIGQMFCSKNVIYDFEYLRLRKHTWYYKKIDNNENRNICVIVIHINYNNDNITIINKITKEEFTFIPSNGDVFVFNISLYNIQYVNNKMFYLSICI